MKYKVGDRVRIKPLEEFQLLLTRNLEGNMDKYAGTIMTIQAVNLGHYKMIEDQVDIKKRGGWFWFEEMIDKLYLPYNKTQLIKLLMKG